METASHRNRGFTVVELMIVIAVLALLTAAALPTFRDLMARNRVTTAANDLLSAFLLARSEAVKRERRVVVQRTGSDWKSWQVFVDKNSNGSRDTDEALLAEGAAGSGLSLATVGNLGTSVTYTPRGRASLSGTNGLKISAGSQTRYLCLSTSGRPRIQENSCS